MVCEHVDPVGQADGAPTVQGTSVIGNDCVGEHKPLQATGVHSDPVEQPDGSPTAQGGPLSGVAVGRHWPRVMHHPVGAHDSVVGVHSEPVEQPDGSLTVQGGPLIGVAVGRHWPLHVSVGVHVSKDGQSDRAPITQPPGADEEKFEENRVDEEGEGMQTPVHTEANAHVWLG